MMISSGARFGPYEIIGPIGAGGMGEVYRAKDPRLKREVAIKILPEEAEANADRQKRFQREAQAASALNHPNILTIYDIGNEGGRNYIVSELVLGEPLRNLIAKGPVPARKLLSLAVQVADGLASAHKAGIVHRDLKPENIMVTEDSQVKILDFGLAKLTTAEPAAEYARTESRQLTETGMIQGTVPYMSPEQASGSEVDFRSDQFSFGLVLYEMVSGKRAFQRNTSPQILSAIISEEPEPISVLSPKTPAPLQWLIARCMAKDPRQRYDSTADLFRDLRDLRDYYSESNLTQSSPALSQASKSAGSKHLLLIGSLLLLASLASFLAGKRFGSGAKDQANEKPVQSFQLLTFNHGFINSARFTPDGNTVVYGAAWGGHPFSLYSTRLDGPESVAVSLPPANLLAVSSSGELALALPNETLARAPIGGGAPREVLENVRFADWSPDGKELVVARSVNGMDRIEYPIGKVLYETPGSIYSPRVSPQGDLVAFVENPEGAIWAVGVVNRTGEKKTFSAKWNRLSGLSWSPSGQEILVSFAVDRSTSAFGAFTLSGQFRSIATMDGGISLEDISSKGDSLLNRGHFRFETRGLPFGQVTESDFSWLSRSIISGLSADGQTLIMNEGRVIYLRKADGSPAVKLGEGKSLALSPDGRFVLAVAPTDTPQLILLPTGPGDVKPVQPGKITDFDFAGFFPDGKRIVISGIEPGHSWRLYVQDLAGGLPHPFTPDGVFTFAAAPISRDGKWVAGLASTAQGSRSYLYPIDGGEARPLSDLTQADSVLAWSEDGRSIYVTNPGQFPVRIYRMDLSSGKKELWKEITIPDTAGVDGVVNILIAPDAKAYFYSYLRRLSELYLATGLK